MYESFYHLSGKPFQLSPDSRFFFNSAGHNRAMAYLRYGLRQGEGFIVITGGIGTGKSMLVANLFAELASEEIIAAQIVSTQVGEDDLLRLISASFGLEHSRLNKTDLLQNLERFFRARCAEGKRVLLVIDEAQNLPRRSIEELRMLSNYQEGGQALLQSFLIGQAELKSTLQGSGMEQVRQRIIAGYHLRPLDREELQSYIEHRLSLVGWSDNPHITTEAFDHIFHASGGVPRRVNTMVDRLLLYGALEELSELTSEHVDSVVNEIAEEVGYSPVSVDEDLDIPDNIPKGNIVERMRVLESELDKLKDVVNKDRILLKQAAELLMEINLDE